MGKNTKIICTVVPNPIRTKESGKPSFSIFLTPRLPDSGNLKDYYEIANWFKFLSMFTNNQWLKVRLAKLTTSNNTDYTLTEESNNGYSISRDNGLCSRDYLQQHRNYSERDYYLLGRKIWEKMFQNKTPVKGWIFAEGDKKDNKVTQIFTKDEVEKLIEDAKLRENGISASVSALTPKQRSQMIDNLGLMDITAKKMSEDEIRLRNKENQEFHKKISILSDYPHLLRLTGWIFDFQIEADISNVAFDIVKLDLSGLSEFVRNQPSSDSSLWANFSNEIDFKTPWTYVDKTMFSIRYLDKLKKEYFQIENGFIRASGDAYDLVACQFDHNQLKAKLTNSDETEKEKTKEAVENRASDLTSTGIGIKVVKKSATQKLSPFEKGLYSDPDSLNSSITIKQGAQTIKNDSANIDDYIIFGHNLDAGYRVDVSMQKADGNYTDFKSLCWRNADYKIDKSPYSDKREFIDLLTNFKDEPWISESAQAGKSGTLYVDEELCRWNNWSLTCPHIGNYPQDETNVKENHEFNDLELKNIRPTDKTLTPLRFSRKYKFRIRVVDICGNSSNESDTTTSPFEIILKDDSITTARETEYKRLETANPPELHFTENIYEGKLRNRKGDFVERKLKDEFYGEDLNTFIVRTKIKGNNIIVPENSVRSVCPPRVTQSFVELHGTIDDLLKDPKERKPVYEKASYENTNTDAEIFKHKEEIPFLTDPKINSFEVKVEGLNSFNPGDIWNQLGKPYIQRKFSSIFLKCINPFDTQAENVKTDSEAIIVELKVGSILKGTIESIIPESDKTKFHSDSLLKDDNGNSIAGKYSQPKKLLFINAVQKPVILNSDGTTRFISNYTLHGSLRKRTPAIPISLMFESLTYLDNKFPLSTTGEIKIIAEYDEIICDKTKKQGFIVEKKKLVKAFSNFGEGISLKVDDNNDSTKLLGVPEFKALEHSFGDTKYRRAKYSIELVSRFKDYFPNENEFSVLGVFKEPIKIENSKKLESLVIDSIVPVFSWEESDNEVVRKHNIFRIYLDGDWYQNGASIEKNAKEEFEKFEEVEKIAIFFLEKEETIDDECEGLVSEFGKDPSVIPKIIDNADERRTKGLYKNFFKVENTLTDFVGYNDNDKINALLLERGESSFSVPIATPSNPKDIKAAIFPVEFDSTKKKFFCDIKLNIENEKKLYFPFLKLAVARYLKTSIREDKKYDYRFSNIVIAPQVQFFPVRKIDKENNFSIFQSNGDGSNIVNDFASKKLEVYLIMERNNEAEFSKLVDEKIELASVCCIKLTEQVTYESLLKDSTIQNFNPEKMYIEEFEVYNVWDTDLTKDFKMDENENYNPRNDIRKRLIFTYKIK